MNGKERDLPIFALENDTYSQLSQLQRTSLGSDNPGQQLNNIGGM